MGRGANSELSRIKPRVRGSGQGFLGALKREPIELDRCKIGSKVAASGDEALRSHVAKSSLKSIRVGEVLESAPGHLDLSPLGSDRGRDRPQPQPIDNPKNIDLDQCPIFGDMPEG